MSRLAPCRRTPADPDRERGSASLELAILAPALLLLLGLVALAGRVQVAAGAVEHAATSAAREASLARTADGAQSTATATAVRDLEGQDIRCASSSVTVDTSGFGAPLGQSATVSASVTCTVSFADLAVPGLPGSRTMTATATSPIDRFRAR
ncbi:TadE/TadG family type IV pilus assembly protein [Cellulomonas hominis]